MIRDGEEEEPASEKEKEGAREGEGAPENVVSRKPSEESTTDHCLLLAVLSTVGSIR